MIHVDALSIFEIAAVGVIGAAINALAGGGTLLSFPVPLVLGTAGAIGALIGAILLTRTSSSAFRAVVPGLILFACLLLAAQPLVSRWLAASRTGPARIGPLLTAGDAAGGVYGAFFGAGLGVMLLGVRPRRHCEFLWWCSVSQ